MLTGLGILELNNIAWPSKSMWLELPPDASGLLSPYKLERTPPTADLHSHSPLQLLNFPTSHQGDSATSYGAYDSLHPLMPPPPLPSHTLQRQVSWESSDFANDPFVDAKHEDRDEVLGLPAMDYDARDENNALQSLARMRGCSSSDYFPSLLPLQGFWKNSTQGAAEHTTDRNRKLGSADGKCNENIRPSTMSLDHVLDNDHYVSYSQQRAISSSIPGLGSGSESFAKNGASLQPLSFERILRSTGSSSSFKENFDPIRPGTRHGIETRSRAQSIVSETEVLGELKNNETPFESPESQRTSSKGRTRKVVTPGKAAGEKRKRPALGNGRVRKNTSVNSTPSSARKASKRVEVLGDMALGDTKA